MSKTIKDVLEQHAVEHFQLLRTNAPRELEEKSIEKALNDIEAIIKNEVIGHNKQDEHKEWDCPCGATHSFTEEWHATNSLRDEQNKALLKALGRGEK